MWRIVMQDKPPMDSQASPRAPEVMKSPSDGFPQMTVTEARNLYPNEWILMLVSGHDDGMPSSGRILAHSFDRSAISDELAKQPPGPRIDQDGNRQPYYIFNAGSPVGSKIGMDAEEAEALLNYVDLLSVAVGMRRRAADRR